MERGTLGDFVLKLQEVAGQYHKCRVAAQACAGEAPE